jgi:hypothetical protein
MIGRFLNKGVSGFLTRAVPAVIIHQDGSLSFDKVLNSASRFVGLCVRLDIDLAHLHHLYYKESSPSAEIRNLESKKLPNAGVIKGTGNDLSSPRMLQLTINP